MRRLKRFHLHPVRIVTTIAAAVVVTISISFAIALVYHRLPHAPSTEARSGYIDFPGEPFTRRWMSFGGPFDTAVFTVAKKKGELEPITGSRKGPSTPPSWSAVLDEWRDVPDPNQLGYPDLQFADVALGFPFHSMLLRVRASPPGTVREPSPVSLFFNVTDSGLELDEQVVAGIHIGQDLWQRFPKRFDNFVGLKILPTRVLWGPMVLNVAFYAILVWLLSLAVSRVLLRRSSIEACRKCGYPRGGLRSGKCPECGQVHPQERGAKVLAGKGDSL